MAIIIRLHSWYCIVLYCNEIAPATYRGSHWNSSKLIEHRHHHHWNDRIYRTCIYLPIYNDTYDILIFKLGNLRMGVTQTWGCIFASRIFLYLYFCIFGFVFLYLHLSGQWQYCILRPWLWLCLPLPTHWNLHAPHANEKYHNFTWKLLPSIWSITTSHGSSLWK